VAVSVRGFARVYVRGASADRGGGGRVTPATAEAARGLVRAMIAQLAVFHAPDDVLIAVVPSPERRREWEWVKWLPHNLHPSKTDAVGPVRLVATSAAELEQRLDDLIANRPRFNPGGGSASPHLVVVLDGGELTGSAHLATDGGVDGVTLLDLD